MRFRQVHLDFHTSEHIEDIGKKFDKKQFQTALKKGHINSITLFSKCHHGWAYHPSKANEIHPHLDFDLLANLTEGCNGADIKEVCEKLKMSAINDTIATGQEQTIGMDDVEKIKDTIKSSVQTEEIEKLEEFQNS